MRERSFGADPQAGPGGRVANLGQVLRSRPPSEIEVLQIVRVIGGNGIRMEDIARAVWRERAQGPARGRASGLHVTTHRSVATRGRVEREHQIGVERLDDGCVGRRLCADEEFVSDERVNPRVGPLGSGSRGVERLDPDLVRIEGGVEGRFVPGFRGSRRENDRDEHRRDGDADSACVRSHVAVHASWSLNGCKRAP